MVVAVHEATVMPIKSGEATLVVEREGDDKSKVTMELRYVPKGGPFGRVIGAVVDGQFSGRALALSQGCPRVPPSPARGWSGSSRS
jgi:hypothetical protein